METQNKTAYVLADQEAPYSNDVKYDKIKLNRSQMLCEAYSLISSMNERQISIFLKLIGKD